jgi:hypothetical protein
MHDGIFDVKKAHKLDNPERVKNLKPVELLKDIAKVSSGETCVDFGSGYRRICAANGRTGREYR